MKLDPVVKKQTKMMLIGAMIMTAVEQAAFLLIPGAWCVQLLCTNVLMALVMVLNFFLLGLTVQSAVISKEDDARNKMKLSQTFRFLMIIAVLGISYGIIYFLDWDIKIFFAMLPPLIFNRITILVYSLTIGRKEAQQETYAPVDETQEEDDND